MSNVIIPDVAVLNTGVANSASVLYALERLGVRAELTQNPTALSKATHVVLPGVGTAFASMERIKALGLVSCLQDLKQPVLGICLGMQLFYEESEEGPAGNSVSCLGIFPGKARKMKVNLPIPHMGWNQVKMSEGNDGSQVSPALKRSQLLNGIPDQSYFYFVHSFVIPEGGSEIKATSDYGISVPAIVENRNWFGTQFHPERSGAIGQAMLKNFIEIRTEFSI